MIAVELKAIDTLVEENEYQLVNYLNATTIETGLLLNFEKKPQIKRKIFDNDKKKMLKLVIGGFKIPFEILLNLVNPNFTK